MQANFGYTNKNSNKKSTILIEFCCTIRMTMGKMETGKDRLWCGHINFTFISQSFMLLFP